jgi:hypothetical protein
MLKLALPGSPNSVLLGRGAVLCACGSDDLRTWVRADLARRTAGRGAVLLAGGAAPAAEVLSALNVHPPVPGPHGDAHAHLGGAAATEPPTGDPLVTRLRWLSDDIGDDRLPRWRSLVAGWAEQPSAAIHPATRSAVVAALEDGLNSSRALQLLSDLAVLAVPQGAKFETFAWADQLLGLDLARDVGR